MRAAVLIVAAVGLLGAGMSRAQVRHAWSVAPSLRLGLAPPRARHTVALDAHGARRRLDAASQRRAEARGRSFGEALPLTNVSIAEAGEWETLHDGSRLWRLVLSCPGASSVHFFSDAFELLPGDRLYVHGGGRVGTRGAYSEANNAPHRTFASPPMPGACPSAPRARAPRRTGILARASVRRAYRTIGHSIRRVPFAQRWARAPRRAQATSCTSSCTRRPARTARAPRPMAWTTRAWTARAWTARRRRRTVRTRARMAAGGCSSLRW